MKKLIALILSIISGLTVFAFSACGNTKPDAAVSPVLTVYAPDGAPALSIAKFIADGDNFGTDADVSYNVVAASSIGQVMQQGKGDIIIMPVNAASKLYKANSSDKYKMAGVITHGNLYIMSKENITLQDLKGKVVGVIGQGNVPDLTLKAVLTKNGLEYETSDTAVSDKVALKYFADGSELVPTLIKGNIEIGLLPEPAANTLISRNSAYNYALDLQELYDAETKAYPQAVVMMKSSLIKEFPQIIDNFGGKIAGAVSWVKENPLSAAGAVQMYAQVSGLTPSFTEANLNGTVIDNCKIYWQSSADAKTAVKDYLTAIIAIEQKAANAVSDDFFA